MHWISKEKIPFWLLLLTFIFESLGGQLTYFVGHSFGLSFLLKTFIFLYAIRISFAKFKKMYAFIAILFLLFVISQFTYTQFEFDVFKNFHMFINYIYPFVLVMGFSQLITANNASEIQKLYLIGITVLLGSILIGALINVPSLTTYSNRFGFKGLIPSAATVSYFIIICWIVLLQKEWENKYTNILIVALFICTFLVGTKAAILFLLFVAIHLICYRKLQIKPWKLALAGGGFATFLVIVSQVYKEKFQVTKEIFTKLYTEENLFSALSSFRTRKLIDYTAYYAEYWESINYFVGGRHVFIENFELDLLDLLLHFGIIGTIIYIFVFKKLLLPLIEKNQQVLFIGLLVIAALAGQLFYNTYINLLLIYFLLIQQYLKPSTSKQV